MCSSIAWIGLYCTMTCTCYGACRQGQPSRLLHSHQVPSTPACGCAGEINTLQGNLNWVASREHSLTAPVWKGREAELLPLCNAAESDSANLDHVAELLMRSGVPATQVLSVAFRV